jgi:hypothetical protein
MSFSKPPRPTSKSKPAPSLGQEHLAPADKSVALFKSFYVVERRVLDAVRLGNVETPYNPSKKLDGGKLYDTPEEKVKRNEWATAYEKLIAAAKPTPPVQYLRVLFFLLRGTSVATPTVVQLASKNNLEMVSDFLKLKYSNLQSRFISESSRARTAIVYSSGNKPDSVQELLPAVYSTVLDTRLELSALFRYCLAADILDKVTNVAPAIVNQNIVFSRLKDYSEKIAFLAAWDYTVFPEIYDRVYGKTLPDSFKKLASTMVQDAVVA